TRATSCTSRPTRSLIEIPPGQRPTASHSRISKERHPTRRAPLHARRGCGGRLPVARPEAGVQEARERQRHGVQAVDADTAAGQGADCPTVAEVDPDVAAAAPDDEVARMAVVAADAVVPAIRGVERVGRSAAERGGVPVVALTKGEQHEARTVEPSG